MNKNDEVEIEIKKVVSKKSKYLVNIRKKVKIFKGKFNIYIKDTKTRSIFLYVVGYMLFLVTLILDLLEKNSEKLGTMLNALFNYLGKSSTTIIIMLLVSITFMSFGKLLMRINKTISFSTKYYRILFSLMDIFISIISIMSFIFYSVFNLTLYFKVTIMLDLFVKLNNEKILMGVSIILVLYIYFIFLELIETIFRVFYFLFNKIYKGILNFSNSFHNDIREAADRYSIMITIVGLISGLFISLITILK